MLRPTLGIFSTLLALASAATQGQPGTNAVTQRPWFEARTAHFCIYSCGATQEVACAAARLEEFREAYSRLAGAQAVASRRRLTAFPYQAAMRAVPAALPGQTCQPRRPSSAAAATRT